MIENSDAQMNKNYIHTLLRKPFNPGWLIVLLSAILISLLLSVASFFILSKLNTSQSITPIEEDQPAIAPMDDTQLYEIDVYVGKPLPKEGSVNIKLDLFSHTVLRQPVKGLSLYVMNRSRDGKVQMVKTSDHGWAATELEFTEPGQAFISITGNQVKSVELMLEIPEESLPAMIPTPTLIPTLTPMPIQTQDTISQNDETNQTTQIEEKCQGRKIIRPTSLYREGNTYTESQIIINLPAGFCLPLPQPSLEQGEEFRLVRIEGWVLSEAVNQDSLQLKINKDYNFQIGDYEKEKKLA